MKMKQELTHFEMLDWTLHLKPIITINFLQTLQILKHTKFINIGLFRRPPIAEGSILGAEPPLLSASASYYE